MIKGFATKVNKNGWNYKLEIDTDKKTFRYGIFMMLCSTNCTMTKKQLDEIVSLLIADGYKKMN